MDQRHKAQLLQICALGRLILTAISTYISVQRRRRQMLQAYYLAQLTLAELPPPRPPRASPYIWEERRFKLCWEVTIPRDFTHKHWIEDFRMSRETFFQLCDIIGPFVGPQEITRRPPVPTEKRIAIAIYKLASCAEYRVVA